MGVGGILSSNDMCWMSMFEIGAISKSKSWKKTYRKRSLSESLWKVGCLISWNDKSLFRHLRVVLSCSFERLGQAFESFKLCCEFIESNLLAWVTDPLLQAKPASALPSKLSLSLPSSEIWPSEHALIRLQESDGQSVNGWESTEDRDHPNRPGLRPDSFGSCFRCPYWLIEHFVVFFAINIYLTPFR